MYTVDVIIPTYQPGRDFLDMMELLHRQTLKPSHIIIMNTEEKFFERLIYGSDFLQKYGDCRIYHHSKREFDHGATRNRGVSYSDADYFVMMTQDAVPADNELLENLIRPLTEHKAAVSYARQLPKADCGPIERFTREFNYPPASRIKSGTDLDSLGIKTYFCSDVCAAYDREIFKKLGGFVKPAIFNEDMIYAAGAVKAGYGIAYCGDARVYHSHNYTPGEQFKRNFDLGVSQTDHPEVFDGLASEGEGIRMVKKTAAYLWRSGSRRLLPRLVRISAAKWIGYRLGRSYRRLPERFIMKCTGSPLYFRKLIQRGGLRTGETRRRNQNFDKKE